MFNRRFFGGFFMSINTKDDCNISNEWTIRFYHNGKVV